MPNMGPIKPSKNFHSFLLQMYHINHFGTKCDVLDKIALCQKQPTFLVPMVLMVVVGRLDS